MAEPGSPKCTEVGGSAREAEWGGKRRGATDWESGHFPNSRGVLDAAWGSVKLKGLDPKKRGGYKYQEDGAKEIIARGASSPRYQGSKCLEPPTPAPTSHTPTCPVFPSGVPTILGTCCHF